MENTTTTAETSSRWYGTEPEIDLSEINESIETEVLICGAGNAGMMGAMAAAKEGAKTLVIEKSNRVGLIKPYMGAIDTKAQKAAGDKARIDKEEIVQELLSYGKKLAEEKKVYGPNYRPAKYKG